MIGLALAGRPGRLLARKHGRQAIEICDDRPVNQFVQGEEPGLVCQQLAYGDPLLAVLRELGPIAANTLVIVEPAA